MGAIYLRELKSYFTTPIGYIFLAVYFAVSGFVFSYTTFLQAEASSVANYFVAMIFVLAVMLPILTMKLFSDDRRIKTEQLLLTSPISLTGMVMAKYLAALTVYAGALAFSSTYFLFLGLYGTPPTAIIFGNLLALLFLGATFIAVGAFMSSLTESQLIAAISSMLVIMLVVLASFAANSLTNPALRTVMKWFSIFSRMSTFSAGIINLGSLIYFTSFAFMFLFLTVRVYEKRRWS